MNTRRKKAITIKTVEGRWPTTENESINIQVRNNESRYIRKEV